jgi:hypothetical protein
MTLVLIHDMYRTVAASPIGFFPADISFFVTLLMTSIAFVLLISVLQYCLRLKEAELYSLAEV